jgi:hypothetical protein
VTASPIVAVSDTIRRAFAVIGRGVLRASVLTGDL